MMVWGPALADGEEWEGEGGWQLTFGEDPDLRGGQISLSINPPGGIVGGLFVGIKTVSVVAIDNTFAVAGGWGFNTDQMTGVLGSGIGANSLANNWMHQVTINIGAGPAPGSAWVVGAPGGPYVGPNYLIPGNNNFGNIVALQFFENGILRGSTGIPFQPIPRLLNYWDHVTVSVPPRVPCTATPAVLWPPNHKMHAVTVSMPFANPPAGSTAWVTVASSEPDDGQGDGNTTGDVDGQSGNPLPADVSARFSSGAAGIAGRINLRAERGGGGGGRTYTIVVNLVGPLGNLLAVGICTVDVPQSQGKK